MIKPKRFDQMVPGFAPYDAISNEVLIIRDLLRAQGFESGIFAEHIHTETHGICRNYTDYEAHHSKQNSLILHFSVGTPIIDYLFGSDSRVICRYHNITPKQFFVNDGEYGAYMACALGRRQMPMVSRFSRATLAVSEYNARELRDNGFLDVGVVPLLRNYDALLAREDDGEVLQFLRASKKASLLFVGRIAPNKCQHDLLELLRLYQRVLDENVRLVLIGAFFSADYKEAVETFASRLGLRVAEGFDETGGADVVVLRDVSETQLATFYRHSAAFVCMSEHEGFCAPLVEAMAFGLPLLAHCSSAIPETVGDGGMLVDKHHWPEVVGALHEVLKNQDFREKLRVKAKARARHFAFESVAAAFEQRLQASLPRLIRD